MRDGVFRKRHAAFRTDVGNWGWGLADGAPAQDLERLISPQAFRSPTSDRPQDDLLPRKPLFGQSLRTGLRRVVQRQITLGFLIEQLPSAANRITIDDGWRDQLGLHKPVLEYDIDDYSRAGVAEAYGLAAAIFRQAGIRDYTNPDALLGSPIEYEGARYRYIGAGHIMGTHRMGVRPADSVVDPFQRSWDHKNLFIVGCGSMPTAGTANPTLTAVALSIRSAEEIFKDLDLARR
jgi:choline dehydrogenase-like flavoprotein